MIVVVLCVIIFPLYIMFKMAFSEPQDVFNENPSYLISHFTGEHFLGVWRSGEVFLGPLLKSIVAALGVSILSLLISIPAAYGISRLDYKLRMALLFIIFASRMIPEVSIALPVSINFIKLGLLDSHMGLILAHLIRILPITCFILVGVFRDIPQELEEQARVDGCNRWQAFVKIVLPISTIGIGVAGIMAFLFSWDEFIYASYLCLAEPTMPLQMYYYVARGNIFFSASYAVIITVPVLLLTLFFQKYLKPEYLSGGVEG